MIDITAVPRNRRQNLKIVSTFFTNKTDLPNKGLSNVSVMVRYRRYTLHIARKNPPGRSGKSL